MNILPKKRWHVRTKENIARVRRDEAEAAEKERIEKLRTDAADREARLNVLKQKSKEKLLEHDIETEVKGETNQLPKHIDLFSNFEHAIQTTNKNHDREVKEQKEEYEKKIGYLTYLGQDTNEALGKKNWYELPPQTSLFSTPENVKDTYEKLVLKDEDGKPRKRKCDEKDGEVSWKAKQCLDPMKEFKSLSSKPISKTPEELQVNLKCNEHKSIKNKNDTKKSLQELREARLKREEQEKYRTNLFLNKLSGISPENTQQEQPNRVRPKYNSQFNPELARQNYRI